MSDFSLTTLFVVPVGQAIATTGAGVNYTQDLAAGQVGFFKSDYSTASAANIAASHYFYVAQGRTNKYLEGTKRSDKIAGCVGSTCKSNVIEAYKVTGCATPVNQITQITDFNVHCGDVLTVTLRAFSSYIETLYFNGLTRSVTVQAPCCDCGSDPCDTVDTSALIDQIIAKFTQHAPGINPDNLILSNFFTFTNVGGTVLQIEGKPLTKYGQPCDVAAFPFEFDRLRFNTFVYSGPATTADFIVADNCNIVATSSITQNSNYARGTSEEIAQLEKNFYSYQTGFLKHLYRMAGYNQAFESFVSPGATYDTFYLKFNEYGKGNYNWGDYVPMDSTVIIAAQTGSSEATTVGAILNAALGSTIFNDTPACITTTTTTTTA